MIKTNTPGRERYLIIYKSVVSKLLFFDNGLGKGARIAYINTGAPLGYKVVIDRGLDIADAFY
jgi:hypothetical protein